MIVCRMLHVGSTFTSEHIEQHALTCAVSLWAQLIVSDNSIRHAYWILRDKKPVYFVHDRGRRLHQTSFRVRADSPFSSRLKITEKETLLAGKKPPSSQLFFNKKCYHFSYVVTSDETFQKQHLSTAQSRKIILLLWKIRQGRENKTQIHVLTFDTRQHGGVLFDPPTLVDKITAIKPSSPRKSTLKVPEYCA